METSVSSIESWKMKKHSFFQEKDEKKSFSSGVLVQQLPIFGRINSQKFWMLKLPLFDHSVTHSGCKQAAAHFWELILQFCHARWESSG
jgi:hypothetical protein